MTHTFILKIIGSMQGQEYDFLISKVFFSPYFAIKNLYIHIMFYESSRYFCTFQCEKEEKTNSSEQNVKQFIRVIIFSYGNTVLLWCISEAPAEHTPKEWKANILPPTHTEW